ncbi:General aromatic amino acid permease [Achromobacter spanius]|uniref:amino acid permease n=1 Tax=Achromobacter spanius TaxID=217203 RepID=UPI000C2C03E5|nr:amino acid permease [Achromobacter spanius]AUA56786.1 amino acid permease [Achromobacter spanius]CAB3710501.1 Amino-acid permease RocC [Achromobacter spanius]SPT42368.1 General aromatic amino acid permease [Achromobacter denitrificans]VEE55591.1 General aromatic amino acid permease [Achromobacter spanius]
MKKPQGFGQIAEREQGLKRRLTSGQMSMIAIGGAIGTGLFLGSKFAIGFAGPSVILSYAIGGLITLLLMGCLAEMTVAHSTSGSFGAYAEHYIGPLAGFLVRYAYWSCVVLAVGTEVTAVAEYMHFWFPDVPGWLWVCVFSGALILVNAMSVKAFGTIEYWFSTVKITAIVAFIILGAYVVWGNPQYGVAQYTAHGGFFPNGLWGMWIAVVISIFSYLSVEMIAVAAGEAEDPERAVKKAFRATIVRLVVFYLLTLTLILAIVPWNEAGKEGSPFVKVMLALDIPGAAGVINFIVLVAALSAMNSQLYITTRMMFSLSRAGHAPSLFGRLTKSGTPLNALLLSTSGIAIAVVLKVMYPDTAFTLMMAISMFGALFTWMMIFVTHYFFRRRWAREGGGALSFRMPGFPVLTLLGAVAMLAILVTTYFTNVFQMTLVFGVPFLLILAVLYGVLFKKRGEAVVLQARQQRG